MPHYYSKAYPDEEALLDKTISGLDEVALLDKSCMTRVITPLMHMWHMQGRCRFECLIFFLAK